MRVRIRTHVTAVVVIVVMAIGSLSVLVASAVAYRGLQTYEGVEVRSTLEQASQAIAIESDRLSRTGMDWSNWDDAYRYVQDGNDEFSRSNMSTDTLTTLREEFMGYLDSSGDLVRATSLTTSLSVDADILPHVRALTSASELSPATGITGVVATEQGPVLLSVQPVLKSDTTGPSAGTFFVGHRLDGADAEQLSRLVGADVELLSTDTTPAALAEVSSWADQQTRADGAVIIVSRDVASGYKQIEGVDGKPGVIVGITQPRTTMIQAGQTSSYLIVAGLISALGLIVALVVSIDMVVTRRLARLSAAVTAVSAGDNPDVRVSADGTDEITDLAGDINSMLSAVQESQAELEYVACHDALTELYNRRRFEEEMERELKQQERLGGKGALLWLDVDNFKEINDRLGHSVGDRALVEFARELLSETRGYATLARIGGDEFALILPQADRDEAEQAAERLVQLLRVRAFAVDAERIHLLVSIGIALYPEHATEMDDLLAAADVALYDAKKHGGNRYCVYNGQRLAP